MATFMSQALHRLYTQLLTKLGVSGPFTAPAANAGVLRATGAGTSDWAKVQVGDIAFGVARQLLQTNAAGTAAEWTGNIAIPAGGTILPAALSGTPDANAIYRSSTVKGWGYIDTGGNVNAGYNISSVSDNGVGDWSINWNRDFAGASYCALAIAKVDGDHNTTIADSSFAAGVTRVRNWLWNTGAAVDPNQFFVAAFGEQ